MLLAGATALILTVGGPSRAEISQVVDRSGPLAPLVFVVLYTILTVLLFPGAVLTVAGGIVFGIALGTLYSVVGATVGAVAAYHIARGLGREQVERISGERLGRVDAWLERNGFVAVLYLRLVPLFPFNALNYAVGVTGVRPRDYTLATVLGIIPGTFAFAALGGSLDDPTSPFFIGAVCLILVLAAGGPFLNRRLRAHGRGAPVDVGEDEVPAAEDES